MTTTLFTFLGRPAKIDQGEYRRTAYDFGNGDVAEPNAFFGWPLADRLRPQRMVILGTAGSAWHHVFEGDHDFGADEESMRLALMEAVEQKAVEALLIESLQPLLSGKLGIDVRLQLIPYCQNEDEQVDLLRLLAEHVGEGDHVHIDITHGFRTLPMLSLLAAFFLRRVRHATVDGIWYGAFDPDTGDAPVQNLQGLLGVVDWLEALAVYDHTGDYGPAGKLLREGGMGAELEAAAFFEHINDLGKARNHARKALKTLDDYPEAPASFELFRDELTRRLAWVKAERFYQRQRQLALERLAKGQYHGAILAGQEAFITRLLQRASGLDPHNAEHREKIQREFEVNERDKTPRSELYRAWDELRRLRNAIAHGSRAKGSDVQRALNGPAQMRNFLDELFCTLLPAEGEVHKD